MIAFQVLAVAVLLCALGTELYGGAKRRKLGWIGALRCLIWLTAVIAVLTPDSITTIARILGLHRGADLVSYIFIISYIWSSFYFYKSLRILERKVTEITRCLAIQTAKKGKEEPSTMSSSD